MKNLPSYRAPELAIRLQSGFGVLSMGRQRDRSAGKRRLRFRLRAADWVEKCAWERFREGTKSRPVIVRLTGGDKRKCASVMRSISSSARLV